MVVLGLVVHASIPSTWEAEAVRISEFEVYRVSSRTARATQRNPVSKNKIETNKKQKTKK
jgi:nucleoid DNA-binding protein